MPTDERVEFGAGGEVARQGRNDFGKAGYGGPCPPGGTHHYVFRIYALDMLPAPGPGRSDKRVIRL